MIATSGLYIGSVVHNRWHPKRHRLFYRCYWMLLDLDEIAGLDRRLRWFSHNRLNAFSLCDVDYVARRDEPLKSQVLALLQEAGIDLEGGKILLLAMPRILGYAFNPISIYYCYGQDGRLAALLYEVHNTFRQRHSYLIAVESDAGTAIVQRCPKRFYVSPFLKMDLDYAFRVVEPGDNVRLAVEARDAGQMMLSASLSGERAELTDANLLRVFFSHPLLTAKVITAIHWEAARLWWKGVRLIAKPDPPERVVTISGLKYDHGVSDD